MAYSSNATAMIASEPTLDNPTIINNGQDEKKGNLPESTEIKSDDNNIENIGDPFDHSSENAHVTQRCLTNKREKKSINNYEPRFDNKNIISSGIGVYKNHKIDVDFQPFGRNQVSTIRNLRLSFKEINTINIIISKDNVIMNKKSWMMNLKFLNSVFCCNINQLFMRPLIDLLKHKLYLINNKILRYKHKLLMTIDHLILLPSSSEIKFYDYHLDYVRDLYGKVLNIINHTDAVSLCRHMLFKQSNVYFGTVEYTKWSCGKGIKHLSSYAEVDFHKKMKNIITIEDSRKAHVADGNELGISPDQISFKRNNSKKRELTNKYSDRIINNFQIFMLNATNNSHNYVKRKVVIKYLSLYDVHDLKDS